jgi:hypothetical protein
MSRKLNEGTEKNKKEFKIADVPTEIITPKSLDRYRYNNLPGKPVRHPIFKQGHS